ncbi:MlaD family protein [Pseudonocardia spinosispora]|uniref:MlaD family protein n=1 Tax=Pseudonocardia spinosispora TaxID=103441 RepID=UPI000427D640|nr:MlaD family protein [Pseudonocardia spinosispora]
MNEHGIFGPGWRTATLVVFVAACLGYSGYLYAQAGGALPWFDRSGGYTASFDVDDVGNLVTYSDVASAGVPVGKVAALDRIPGRGIRVVLNLDEMVTPLHAGVTVQIGEKSLAGQPVVTLVDGTGEALPDGVALPPASVTPQVRLRDVLAGLDKPTRDAMGGAIRSMALATDGRQRDISALADGLAAIGASGDTALDAIAAQSTDLTLISQQLQQVFESLDVGRGQIARLVSSTNRLGAATAGQRDAVEAAVAKLPAVLDSATVASGGISRMSRSLEPIAGALRVSAPDLNDSLDRLPATSSRLRGLLPDLHSVLDEAPGTLDRVPDFGDRAREFMPPTGELLRDVNPMLRYLKPYGPDIAQMFSNFGAAIHHHGDDGAAYLPFRPTFTAGTVKPNPVKFPALLGVTNPYPAPGSLNDLRPFSGGYPRIERDGG